VHLIGNNAEAKNSSRIYKNYSQIPKIGKNEDFFNYQRETAQRQRRKRALTNIYGSQIYKNSKNILKQIQN